MRWFLAVLVLAVALTGAARAPQAAITFTYDNTCTSGCAALGLANGDAVSATIAFNDAAVVANATLSAADIVDFNVDFGSVDISFASAAAFSFIGYLNATASAFTGFQLMTGEAIAPVLGDFVDILSIFFSAGPQGGCSADCSTGVQVPPTATGGGADLVRAVPEPASLVLLGTALAGFAFARRRRAA